jgi:hypothetical protein
MRARARALMAEYGGDFTAAEKRCAFEKLLAATEGNDLLYEEWDVLLFNLHRLFGAPTMIG